jgi:alpha-ketoglutarate-dependent taurine dioxygenase
MNSKATASLASIRRKSLLLSDQSLVDIHPFKNESSLPLVIQPAIPDIDLSEWMKAHTDVIEHYLQIHGAVLFRGFKSAGQGDFEKGLQAISLQRMHYMEGATPRTILGDQIYSSTEFPPEYHIALHNELSYVLTWPMKILFYCVTPALKGGETPIADVRRVYQNIPRHIRSRFEENGWMLVRNFGDGLGLPWQTAFRSQNKADIENYFRQSGISWEWKSDDRLRTSQVRHAVTHHPRTGEAVWFNHAVFWHSSSLPTDTREQLLRDFGEDGLPYNTYYGDGTAIDASVIEEIQRVYDNETVAFPWRTGDLLMMDNMLAAHGRRPFEGPRKILVSMGNPFTRTDLIQR